jgi:hypothetical protein
MRRARGVTWHDLYGVRAPPAVVMVAPLEVPRNTSRTQSEGRAKQGPKSAARGIIKAGAPAFGCTVHPLRLQAPRAAYAHKSPGQGDCTATPGWPGGRDGRKSIKSKIIDTTATDSAIVGNMPHFFRTASPARNASNERAGTPRRISRPDRDQDRRTLERATSG